MQEAWAAKIGRWMRESAAVRGGGAVGCAVGCATGWIGCGTAAGAAEIGGGGEDRRRGDARVWESVAAEIGGGVVDLWCNGVRSGVHWDALYGA